MAQAAILPIREWQAVVYTAAGSGEPQATPGRRRGGFLSGDRVKVRQLASQLPRKPLVNTRQTVSSAILIAATALSRFVFRSHYLYDVDSVNFALALKRFDPSVHQPHPPGYFLYICLGRLANLLFHD